MGAHKFTPKVKQLEQINTALEEDDVKTTKSTNNSVNARNLPKKRVIGLGLGLVSSQESK